MAQTLSHNSVTERQERSRLEIDLGRLEANLHALRAAVSGETAGAGGTGGTGGGRPVRICAVVKKNGYGLGAVPLAARLVKAGVDMLAVYSPDEAEQLIRQAIQAPLLIFMPVRRLSRTDLLYRHAVAGRLHLAIHDLGQLEAINQIGRSFGIRMPVHLHLDTGMSRGGLSDAEWHAALDRVRDASHIHLAGLHTHLATADGDPAFAHQQLAHFQRVVTASDFSALPDQGERVSHAANSFASLRDPAYHLDMIRPGLALHGYGPESLTGGPRLNPMPTLLPIMRWVSRLVHVQRYTAGSPVGYGATHRLQRDSTLGVVPIGYGDGYPLALSGHGVVRIRTADGDNAAWHDAPVLGRVNMDQLVVDLTDTPHPAEALMEAEVEIISDDPAASNALPKLAELAGSHCYEMLCRLATSVPRKYRQ